MIKGDPVCFHLVLKHTQDVIYDAVVRGAMDAAAADKKERFILSLFILFKAKALALYGGLQSITFEHSWKRQKSVAVQYE